MQIKKIHISGRDNIVTLAAFIGLGVFGAQILEWNALVSILFACSFICVVANYLTFISVRNRIRLDDMVLFVLALLAVVFSDWQLTFDYYKPVIIVLCSVLCFDQCAETETSEKTCRCVSLLLLLICVMTNALYYGGLRFAYYGSTDSVSLNFSNPNEAAMWLVFLIVLICDSALVHKSIGIKLLVWVCAVSLVPVLYSTESRNCLMAVCFFFAGKGLIRFLKIRKLPRWMVLLITVSPILVYVGYMHVFIPNYDRFSKLFLFLVSEGKPLTARTGIWSDLEMNRLNDILFGNYTEYYGKNLHNSMLTLYCGYGVFFVIVVCRKFYKTVMRMPNAGAQLALVTVWLIGNFEASVFMGVAGIYMLVLLLPAFHQFDENRKNRIKS